MAVFRKSDTVTGLEVRIREAREKLDAERHAVETQRTVVAKAESDQQAAVTAEAAGDENAATAYVEAGQRGRRAAAEIERRTRVVALREAELVDLEQQIEVAAFDQAAQEVARVEAKQVAASKTFAGKFGSVLAAAKDLRAARAASAEARARALELQPDGAQLDVGDDEPDWPDLASLVELIQSGPEQPARTSATYAARAAREAERSDERVISDAVAQALSRPKEYRDDVWAAMPAQLRARAQERFANELARLTRERAAT